MTAEQQKGMSYEEAHAAIPVAKVIKNKAFFDGSYGGDRELPMDVQELNPTKLGDLYHEDVVKTLKAQIAELQEHLEDHKVAFDNVQKELRDEKGRKFPEPGYYLPREVLSDPAAVSLEHLISKAKRVSQVNVVTQPGDAYEITYEADWVKYLMPVDGTEGSVDQTWVVKLGSAAGHLHEPSLINHVSASKQEEIIKRLMKNVGMPDSNSLALAFKQFANEICYGHVSLESVVQKVAGNYKGLLRSEAPHANDSHYMHPYAVPAERLAGNASAEADCVDPKHCCTRNRPLNDQDCKRKLPIANPGKIPVQMDPQPAFGTKGVSAAQLLGEATGVVEEQPEREVDCTRCPLASSIPGCCGGWPAKEPKLVMYSEAALQDPNNLQKAVVMGMVGDAKQQAEARQFLLRYLALNNMSRAAVDAFLKQ